MSRLGRRRPRRVYHRQSLKVSSWEKAEQLRRQMEEGRPVAVPSIDAAVDAFLAEQKARALSEATQRKLKVLARWEGAGV